MKKIFVVEINEKDKNINNEEVINELQQQFDEFSKSEMIGIGVDLSPTYFQITEKYR